MSERSYRKLEDSVRLILEETAKLLRALGLEKTTMGDIADACNMSRANVYRFFKTKHSILRSLMQAWLRDMEDEMEAVLRTRGSAEEKIANMIITYNKAIIMRLMDERKLHEAVRHSINDNGDILRKHTGKMAAFLAQGLRDGVNNGEFKMGNIQEQSWTFLSAYILYTHPTMMEEFAPTLDQETLHRMIRSLTRMLIKGASESK